MEEGEEYEVESVGFEMVAWDPPVHGEVGWIPQRGELMGERERNGEGQGKCA